VTLFHRGQTQADLPVGAWEIKGDRRHLSDFRDAFQRVAPDVVLDMMAMTEQDARDDMSVFKGIARRVVAASSQDVYRAFGRVNRKEDGPPDALPITEDSPLRHNLYPYRSTPLRAEDDPRKWFDDYDKILVERVILGDPELPGTILRLPAVYGPGDYQHRLFEYVKRMDDQRPAILLEERLAKWRWTHGYVENVAAAIALAVTDERAAGRIYNVGEQETLSMAERVSRIGQEVGWQGEVVTVPDGTLPAHLTADINTEQDVVVDTSRIRQELGYTEPISLQEALHRSIAWEREHPPAEIDPQQFDYAAEDAILAGL
jgi:nucleoside-diphosphate-sugar epimerase